MEEIKSSSILMLELAFQTFFENKDYYLKLLNYRGNRSLSETMTRELCALNQEIYATYDMSPEDRDFAAFVFASTQVSVFIWWTQEKPEIPPKRMAKQYYTWLFGHWPEVLDLKFD